MAKKTYQHVVDLLNEHIPDKISRNEFCRVTGINRNSIDRYRAGLGRPNDETLEKLADYFKVSVAWLRGDDPSSYELASVVFECKQLPENERLQRLFTSETPEKGFMAKLAAYHGKYKDLREIFLETPIEYHQKITEEYEDGKDREEKNWHEQYAKMKELDAGLEKYRDTKYRDLFYAFSVIPIGEMDEVIDFLHVIKRSMSDAQSKKENQKK